MSRLAVAEAFPEPPTKKNDLAIELISGSVGGAAQVLVGQVSASRAGILQWMEGRANLDSRWTRSRRYVIALLGIRLPDAHILQRAQTAPKGQFKNTLDILTQTVRKEGPLALYKGELWPS